MDDCQHVYCMCDYHCTLGSWGIISSKNKRNNHPRSLISLTTSDNAFPVWHCWVVFPYQTPTSVSSVSEMAPPPPHPHCQSQAVRVILAGCLVCQLATHWVKPRELVRPQFLGVVTLTWMKGARCCVSVSGCRRHLDHAQGTTEVLDIHKDCPISAAFWKHDSGQFFLSVKILVDTAVCPPQSGVSTYVSSSQQPIRAHLQQSEEDTDSCPPLDSQ